MPLVVLLGGARSGKSALALRLAQEAAAPVVFVATGEALDDEMADRIARHRAERPEDWTTIEEPLDVEGALGRAPEDATVVLDCLTLWVANVFDRGEEAIAAAASSAAAAAAVRPALTVAVSNEVGLGVVPPTPSGRAYRDVLGRVNRIWADAAQTSALVVAGRALPLLEPLDLLRP